MVADSPLSPAVESVLRDMPTLNALACRETPLTVMEQMKQLDLENVMLQLMEVLVAEGQLAEIVVAVPPDFVTEIDDRSHVMNGVSGLSSHRPAVIVVHVVACRGINP